MVIGWAGTPTLKLLRIIDFDGRLELEQDTSSAGYAFWLHIYPGLFLEDHPDGALAKPLRK